MSDPENYRSFIQFPLRFAGSQKELHSYYFARETLFNFQVIINESCKQYRYLL
jgi:hypothetical protein